MRRVCHRNSDPLTLTAPLRERGTDKSSHQQEAEELIKDALTNREAVVTESGALATWNPENSTGRIPKQTFIVRDALSEHAVDWSFSMCNPMDPKEFDRLFREVQAILSGRSSDSKIAVYVTERVIGADPQFALPVRITTNRALTALFTHNMFLPRFSNRGYGLSDDPFELLVFSRAQGDQCVAMDFHRRRGVIRGTKYLGCVKKLMFTVMNYLLPLEGVLPLHCSAVEDNKGDTHLFLGLSGTGKTTLSSDPRRALIGDDEHLWSTKGIANMENGCYAKLINLSAEKEPEIYQAVFGSYSLPLGGRVQPSPRLRPASRERGTVIIENAMVYPDGYVDLNDSRLTENSRASYPLTYLKNMKEEKCGGHPKTIIFLTADANGVLPPIAKLNIHQALLWFLMGYTSKIAGTETGVTTPQSTFSRFFGGPFMPCQPHVYLDLFRKKITEHGVNVYLVNTGWSGGGYEIGKRMDITLTRTLVDAALSGILRDVKCTEDVRFHLSIPTVCPGIDAKLLYPKQMWADPAAYEKIAGELAKEFSRAFDKEFEGKVSDEVAAMCPGK